MQLKCSFLQLSNQFRLQKIKLISGQYMQQVVYNVLKL